MDEKDTLPRPVSAPRKPSLTGRAPRRSRVLVATLFVGLWMLWIFQPAFLQSRPSKKVYEGKLDAVEEKADTSVLLAQPPSSIPKDPSLVPLEAHIMSKCPDAQDCLVKFIVPAMEQTSQMVNWTLSFIGDIDERDGVHCKHGEGECLGNIFALCAAKLYPDPKVSLGFSTCMIRDYEEIPSKSLLEGCALEHGLDFGALNDCASEEDEGLQMLKDSVQRSKDKGVKYSCTVRLNDEFRCVRDGGEWTDCDKGSEPKDLIRDINALYNRDL